MSRLPRQSGFTLAEALVAISLIGILASLLLPMIATSLGKDKLDGITKEAFTEVSQAYTQTVKQKLLSPTLGATDIANNISAMSYVTTGTTTSVTNGSVTTNMCSKGCIQVADADNNAGTGICADGSTPSAGSPCIYLSKCSLSNPCAALQNGALIQYDSRSRFGDLTAGSNSAVRFLMDPDGSGPQTAVSLVLYYTGRLTTRRFTIGSATFRCTDGAGGYVTCPNNLPNGPTDPEYIVEWTNG